MKSTSQIAIGRITGDYQYRDDPDPERRHVRPVEWLQEDIPRTAVKQDLLYSLGAFSTYCGIKRHEAAARIAQLAQDRTDPGWDAAIPSSSKGKKKPSAAVASSDGSDEGDITDDLEINDINLAQTASDQLTHLVQQEFTGHGLEQLVAAILNAQGYTCHVSPEGTDGGIDILAGKGPLGMDSPLVVQVKSQETPVGEPEVNALLGSVGGHQGASGLLVAWVGVTHPARKKITQKYFELRLWDSDAVLERITRYYSDLPEDIRAKIPLKRIWVPVVDA